MKYFYAAIIAIIGLCDKVSGVSIFTKNNEVYLDNQKVDLSKLQVIKETPLYKTYELHSGESTITITKSKVGNSIIIKSVGPMTQEEMEKMKKMQDDIGKDVKKQMDELTDNITSMNREIEKNIAEMHKNMQNMFSKLF